MLAKSQKFDLKAAKVFEALELDSTGSCDFFKRQCNIFPSSVLVKLRDKRIGNEGRTLLHNAARAGALAAVLFLIRKGHDVNTVDSGISKVTPLMDAISFHHIEVSIILVESGASLSCTDLNGENALHYVARTGCCRLARWLAKASGISREHLMEASCSVNVKLQFPEDVAKSSLCREVLLNFREAGICGALLRKAGKLDSNGATKKVLS